MSGLSSGRVAVIGGGPAGLMAAEVLASGGAAVTVYDRMPSVGRKFLLAGRGGLNLTHSEDVEQFFKRYGDAEIHLRAALDAFSPTQLRAWSEGLGQSTFVGSSGRVFPTSFKTSPLLRAWRKRLDDLGVVIKARHHWLGWDGSALRFRTPAGDVAVDDAQATVLALGGGSWPRLGSDGVWVDTLIGQGVGVRPLVPANCGMLVDWSEVFRGRFEGQPLKRIEVRFGDRRVPGEAVVTQAGLEGGAIYALSGTLRDAIASAGKATVLIDLRPGISAAELASNLGAVRGKQSLSTFLRKSVSLSPVMIGLLHEATMRAGVKPAAMDAAALADLIKAVPVRLTGVMPIAKAISTAGGVAFDELDAGFMLRHKPGVFVAGEMLDWEAPTGGYLLQASFATGAAAGRGALTWISR
jgi:uncharacterized flavoprotein (TIGR03862 family)